MRSESQGLVISLIICVCLTVILGITTAIYFKNYDEEKEKRAKAVANQAASDAKYEEMKGNYERLLAWIGLPENSAVDQAQATYEEDMTKYAHTLPEDKKDYHSALEQMHDVVILKQNQELTNTLKRLDDLRAKYEGREKIAAVALKKVQGDQDVALKFTEKGVAENKQAAAARASQLAALNTNVQDSLAENTKRTQAALIKEQEAKALLAEQEAQARALAAKLEESKAQKTDVEDGIIRKSDQRTQTVWINLGRADNLKPGQTFSVYPSDKLDYTQVNDRKGAIQIDRVIGEHTAIARITDQKFSNPFQQGDKIYNPAWHAGRKEHFALAGVLDLNGDGKPDNSVIRNLIRANGGVVDAEVTEDGTVTGKITPSTSFLVEGDRPSDATAQASEVKGRVASATTAFKKDAAANGVPTLSFDKFLDHIGYRKTSTRSTNTSGFKPRSATGSAYSPR